jgi:ribosome-binding protein aMBF1 (putative translation factor)
MRMKGRDGVSRAIYVTAVGQRIIVVRVFIKKTQSTPAREIELALKRAKGVAAMTKVNDLHRKWMKDPGYRRAHAELAAEFAIARAVIEARAHAGITQEQLAQKMETTQSVIARLESGRTKPSTQTLERLAAATGTRLKISFEPKQVRR